MKEIRKTVFIVLCTLLLSTTTITVAQAELITITNPDGTITTYDNGELSRQEKINNLKQAVKRNKNL